VENKNAALVCVAKYCGALLASQTHREVRSNPTYQVRVVFGCNHISHFERNANNSASRYWNRCGVPRRQEHRERSGGDLRGRLRILQDLRRREGKMGERFWPCANADSDRVRQRVLGQQGHRVLVAHQHNRRVLRAGEGAKPRAGHGIHADVSKVRLRLFGADFKSQRNPLVGEISGSGWHDTTGGWNRLFPVPAPKRHEQSRYRRTGFIGTVCLLAAPKVAMGRPLVPGRHGHTLQRHHREPRRVARLSSAVPGFQTTAYVHPAERPMVLRRDDGAREHAREERRRSKILD